VNHIQVLGLNVAAGLPEWPDMNQAAGKADDF